MSITVAHPFPAYAWPRVWGWIETYPDLFLDDDGPRTVEQFIAAVEREQFTWAVERDGEIVGAIWFTVTRPDAGVIHTAFKRSAWGNGVPDAAMRLVLDKIFGTGGCRKVVSIFFADNRYARSIVQRFGLHRDGVLRAEAMRGGKPVDMELWSLLKEEYYDSRERDANYEHHENNDVIELVDTDIQRGADEPAGAPVERAGAEPVIGRDDAADSGAGIGRGGQPEQQLRGAEPAVTDQPERARVRVKRKSSRRPAKS
jgi:RimJ/RimL family protein N-acetyltransferase